jgi:hypothetical protein
MLAHRVTCRRPSLESDLPAVLDGAVEPRSKPPRTLGPPLRGGPWLAANGPGNDSGHRRTQIPLGKPRIPSAMRSTGS